MINRVPFLFRYVERRDGQLIILYKVVFFKNSSSLYKLQIGLIYFFFF